MRLARRCSLSAAGSNGCATGFCSPAGYENWTLTSVSGGYRLADTSGDSTSFTLPTGASAYAPTTITQGAVGGYQVSVSYTVNAAGLPEPSQETVAPTGTQCGTGTTAALGCRTLMFNYSNTRPATATQWGTVAGQLAEIDFEAYNPATQTLAAPIPVVEYAYDTTGALRAVWDPRITPTLQTTYAYTGSLLTQITPPGDAPLEPWTIAYQPAPGPCGTPACVAAPVQAAVSASRYDPTLGKTATWTAAYGVPISGTGAPYAMDAATVANWGQLDLPATATAIFPPDEVPSTSPPADYNRATIYYLDSTGREVNIATPGGRISTTEYDGFDNVIRTLTAANRQTALAAGANAQATSLLLDTESSYAGDPGVSSCDASSTTLLDGTELCSVLGPQHNIIVPGTTTPVLARGHTQYTYDQGLPSGDAPERLITTQTEGASISGQPDADVRTTTDAYSGQSNLGWTLRQPTSVTTDPSGLKLTHSYTYDAATGIQTDSIQPSSAGQDAGDTQTILYNAAGNPFVSGCTNPVLQGLPCVTQPYKQPGTTGLPSRPCERNDGIQHLGGAAHLDRDQRNGGPHRNDRL